MPADIVGGIIRAKPHLTARHMMYGGGVHGAAALAGVDWQGEPTPRRDGSPLPVSQATALSQDGDSSMFSSREGKDGTQKKKQGKQIYGKAGNDERSRFRFFETFHFFCFNRNVHTQQNNNLPFFNGVFLWPEPRIVLKGVNCDTLAMCAVCSCLGGDRMPPPAPPPPPTWGHGRCQSPWQGPNY